MLKSGLYEQVINEKINNGLIDGEIMYQNSNDSYMFYSSGRIIDYNSIWYNGDWSALSGFSGGPIFYYNNISGYTIAGILIGGGGEHGEYGTNVYSSGLIISNNLYKLILSEI